MGEAYEIGVKFAEQEELSGSLEIILQEFASLDDAITASNAGILALMGETGTRTVADIPYHNAAGAAPELQSARGAPVRRVETSGENTFRSSDGEAATTPGISHLGTASQMVIGPALAKGGASGEEPTVRRDIVTSSLFAPRGTPAVPSGRGIVVAPIATAAMAAVVPAQPHLGIDHRERTASIQGAVSPDGLSERAGVPGTTVATGLAGAGVAPFGEGRGIEVSGQDPVRAESVAFRVEAAAPRQDVSFKGSEFVVANWPRYSVAPSSDGVSGGVAEAALPRGEARLPSRERSDAPTGEKSGRKSFEAATAPQMAREPASGAPSGMFSERAAAPRGDSGGRQDDGRAVVMLDGRLVGEMLSGRMARDAGRPGAGTTSFDARQAPAWTPSGAL